MAAESLLNKFLDRIKKERLFQKGDRLILACSGGPDSVALLDILARIKPLFDLRITVAYFNHGLRPRESAKEKDYIQRLGRGYGVSFASREGKVKAFARENKISIQEAGRYLRYNFLFNLGKRLKVVKIVLGHHRDDSVETVLLGVLKGTGLKGLSGIEKVRERNGFLLLRPLLDFSKEEIATYLSERRLSPCLDSSNLKETYLRNRLRLKVIPFLRENINPKVEEAILRLSEIYSRENEYLEGLVSKNIKKVVREKQGRFYIDRNNFLKFHIALARRFLREILDRLGIIGEGSNFRQIEIMRHFISTFRPGQRLDLASGYVVRGGRDGISIEKKILRVYGRAGEKILAAKRAKLLYRLRIPGETMVKDLDIKIAAQFSKKIPSLREMKKAFPEKVFFDRAKIKLPLSLRLRKPGDRFRPLGMKGTTKLKKYFINAKIPQEERGHIPLLVSGGEIIWVTGQAISDRVKVGPETKDILSVKFYLKLGRGYGIFESVE